MTLELSEKRERRHRFRRVRGDGTEHGEEMAHHPPGRISLDDVGVKDKQTCYATVRAFVELEVQIHLGMSDCIADVAFHQVNAPRRIGRRHGRLQLDHGLEQRIGAMVALRLNLANERGERHNVVEGVEHLRTGTRKELGDRRVATNVQAEHERREAVSDKRVQLGPLTQVRHGAEYNVLLA